jgi:hypothetical protein
MALPSNAEMTISMTHDSSYLLRCFRALSSSCWLNGGNNAFPIFNMYDLHLIFWKRVGSIYAKFFNRKVLISVVAMCPVVILEHAYSKRIKYQFELCFFTVYSLYWHWMWTLLVVPVYQCIQDHWGTARDPIWIGTKQPGTARPKRSCHHYHFVMSPQVPA